MGAGTRGVEGRALPAGTKDHGPGEYRAPPGARAEVRGGRRNTVRSKRTLGRRIEDALHYPLTALEGKHGRSRELSQFRVVIFALTVTFITHWPASPWGVWDWATLATL